MNPAKADKHNHTYMTIRQDQGDQWDELSDFDKVGSTAHQLKVPRGNPTAIHVGLEVIGPKYVGCADHRPPRTSRRTASPPNSPTPRPSPSAT